MDREYLTGEERLSRLRGYVGLSLSLIHSEGVFGVINRLAEFIHDGFELRRRIQRVLGLIKV